MPDPAKNEIPATLLMPDDDKYLHGKENWGMRMYYYLQNGLGMLNDFHNIFLALITLALTFHVRNIPLISGITIISLVGFVFIGYYNVHRFSKLRDWLSMRFGTHYGIQSFNFTQGQYELLTEIRDLLKEQRDGKAGDK